MVDQRGRVDDQVDGVGEPLPGVRIQSEVGLALVAGDDLEMVGGQFAVVAQQFGITAVERLHPAVRGPRRRPWRAPGRSPCRRQGPSARSHSRARYRPRNPVAPVSNTVRTSALRTRQRRRRGEGLASMNLSSVRSPACTSVALAAVHRRERRPLAARLPLGLDVGGQRRQVAGRADDDADGHLDVEDLVQQVGERQRGQRISAEIGEVGVGLQIGRPPHRAVRPQPG